MTTSTSAEDLENIPQFARLPMVALFLTVVLSEDESQQRLEAGMHTMRDLAQSGSGLAQQMCRLTLVAIAEQGPYAMLPSAQPSLNDLTGSINAGYDELMEAVRKEEFREELVRDYLRDVYRVAESAVYIEGTTQPSERQSEALELFQRIMDFKLGDTTG